MCVFLCQDSELCKALGVSLHAVTPPPYAGLPIMPGFVGGPLVAPSAVTHTPNTHAADWSQYYYVRYSLHLHLQTGASVLGLFFVFFCLFPWRDHFGPHKEVHTQHVCVRACVCVCVCVRV